MAKTKTTRGRGGAPKRPPRPQTSPPADPSAPDAGEPNWKNRTIFTGDNLHVLRGMNSDSVDLIYLDPPFNSKKDYAAPIGSKAAGAAFKDTWTLSDVDMAWHDQLRHDNPVLHDVILAAWSASGKGMASYLMMMAVRLQEMRRVLKPTGSIYLHCDHNAGAYLKMLMDVIFGLSSYRNVISWRRSTSDAKIVHQTGNLSWGSNTDTLLFYGDRKILPYRDLDESEVEDKFPKVDEKGDRYNTATPLFLVPSSGRRPNQEYEWMGFNPKNGWRFTKERLEEEHAKGNVVITETGDGGRKIERRSYLRDYKGVPVGDIWTDIPNVTGRARTDYPTQKPLKLLERIIKASSKEGEVVLDPFCGCATAPVAAEKLNRRWIGIDLSDMAYDLVKYRLRNDLGFDSLGTVHRTDQPLRTDVGKLPHYRKHKEALFGEQRAKCAGCGTVHDYGNLEVDHIVAKDKGGTDHKQNLQLLCRRCNLRKGTGEMSELTAKLIEDRIGQYA